jgi:phospholipid/cholesterol/gamma-HCH transport system substrate-binding protein
MKKTTTEMIVGLFIIAGFLALVYMALRLGEVPFLRSNSTYTINAEFNSVSGVKKGSAVQVAGVVVGDVGRVWLGDKGYAHLSLRIDKSLKIPVDSIASVKSQGIVGDKFIQLTLGGDEKVFPDGGLIRDTESAIDIESLISKFAFGSAK